MLCGILMLECLLVFNNTRFLKLDSCNFVSVMLNTHDSSSNDSEYGCFLQLLTPSVLIGRLINSYKHLLALRISEYLGMNQVSLLFSVYIADIWFAPFCNGSKPDHRGQQYRNMKLYYYASVSLYVCSCTIY